MQAISRSGTNNLSGAAYGYFRDDSFNAADPVALQVLPYSNQQTGFAIGGPVIKDRLHYFFTYEHENNPATVFTQPPQLGGHELERRRARRSRTACSARADWQISSRDSLSVRASHWQLSNPFSLSGQTYPSLASILAPYSTNVAATWSKVFSNTRVAQLLVGYNRFLSSTLPQPTVFGQPEYDFPGATMGAPFNYPSIEGTHTYQVRYNETWHRDKHEIRFGGEYLKVHDEGTAYYSAFGRMTFLSLPSPAEMARRFPIAQWNNPAAWDVTGLDAIVQRFDLNCRWRQGRHSAVELRHPTADDRVLVRRHLAGVAAPHAELRSALGRRLGRGRASGHHRKHDPDQQRVHQRRLRVQAGHPRSPELRSARRLHLQGDRQQRLRDPRRHRFLLATPVSNVTYSQQLYNRFTFATFNNDGKPGFVTDPTRGVSASDILSGRVPLPPQTTRILSPDFKMPYTWQYSIGFQKQLSSVMSVESDLTGWDWYRDTRSHDPNLFFDPATGYNVDPKFGRPNPELRTDLVLHEQWTPRLPRSFERLHPAPEPQLPGRCHLHADVLHARRWLDRLLEQCGQQRFHRAGQRVGDAPRISREIPCAPGLCTSCHGAFRSAARISMGRAIATHHRVGHTVRQARNESLEPRRPDRHSAGLVDRFDGPPVIASGTVAPRNALLGTPLHKVDARLQKQIALGGRAKLALVAEVFNLFNHDNYGSFVTIINNATFGAPRQSLANAYVPRSGQLGFRFSF